jgi:hypothetical protein
MNLTKIAQGIEQVDPKRDKIAEARKEKRRNTFLPLKL